MSKVALREAASEADVPTVRRLFRDYAAWFEETFQHDLCFQGFEEELAGLPGKYAPPAGNLWIAEGADGPLGIVAIRPLEDDICEMKRLWVAAAARGTGVGRRLIEASFAGAGPPAIAACGLTPSPAWRAQSRSTESTASLRSRPTARIPSLVSSISSLSFKLVP